MTDIGTLLQNAKTIGEAAEGLTKVIEFGGVLLLTITNVKNIVTTYLVGKKEESLENVTDIAILIQISQPAYIDVKNFLEKSNIKAPLFVISHDGAAEGRRLNDRDPAEWLEVVQAFSSQIADIKRAYGSKQYHLFIAAPSVIAFALGSVAKELTAFKLYNFVHGAPDNADKYTLVLNVPIPR